MAATIIPNTVAAEVTDEYTVTDNKDGTFTVSKAVNRLSYKSAERKATRYLMPKQNLKK